MGRCPVHVEGAATAIGAFPVRYLIHQMGRAGQGQGWIVGAVEERKLRLDRQVGRFRFAGQLNLTVLLNSRFPERRFQRLGQYVTTRQCDDYQYCQKPFYGTKGVIRSVFQGVICFLVELVNGYRQHRLSKARQIQRDRSVRGCYLLLFR